MDISMKVKLLKIMMSSKYYCRKIELAGGEQQVNSVSSGTTLFVIHGVTSEKR